MKINNERAPDTAENRLIRIETRLCKYQETNTLALDDINAVLREIRNELIDLRKEVEHA